MLKRLSDLGDELEAWTSSYFGQNRMRRRRVTFADQTVIAIENVRLFEAEQRRTRELSELLEQRTTDWRHRHLSPGSAALHRQADCTVTELGRAGRHRHREHAAAS